MNKRMQWMLAQETVKGFLTEQIRNIPEGVLLKALRKDVALKGDLEKEVLEIMKSMVSKGEAEVSYYEPMESESWSLRD